MDRVEINMTLGEEQLMSIFNVNDGQYRCPNSQQGYTGFTTWTEFGLGHAWFAEEIEALKSLMTTN